MGTAQLPNQGWSHAVGVGGRCGVLWKPTPSVAVGATYMTKVRMSRFKGYDEDLLAGSGGSIDAPEQFGAGISVKPNARLTIGFDFVRTNWSGVKAFSEQAGFGWRDHNIYKFGASYDLTPGLTVRAGTSLAKRSEEHTSELQSLMRISYAVFCLKKKKKQTQNHGLKHKHLHKI